MVDARFVLRAARVTLWLAPALLAPGCGKTNVVIVDGSSTVFLISAAVAESFNDANDDVKVVVSQSGTGGGMKKFAAGEIDICDASRPMSENEAAACKTAGIGFVELEIAFDGLAVVVHPSNDWCDQLALDQLKNIWRPQSQDSVRTWKDVDENWPEVEFKLYGPGEDSGTFDYFTQAVVGKEKSCRSDYSPSENDNALVLGVSGDRGSLGYFGYGYYVENKDKLKLLAVDGGDGPVKPTPATIRDGSYKPLSRPLYIYVRKSSLENAGVAAFVKFYLAEVGELAPRVGYVPVPDEIAARNLETLEAAMSKRKPAPESDARVGPVKQNRPVS
jgi:phosphate transport system substrate-binding protein